MITALKRSLEQGNIFSSVCHLLSTERRGGGRGWVPSMHHRSHDQGVCIQGGSASRGVSIWGGLHLGGLPPEGSASRGAYIQGVLHPGGSASRGLGISPYQILQDTVNERGVRNLLECILV